MPLQLQDITLKADGPIEIRWERVVEDGGQSFAVGEQREARDPGEDISDLPEDWQAAVTAHWTPERTAAYAARVAAMAPQGNDGA
jgi:hypothetical protein